MTETAEEAPEAGDIAEAGDSSRGGIIRGVGTSNCGLGDTSTDADLECLLIAGCWNLEDIGVLGPATTISESTEVTPGCVLLRSRSGPLTGSCDRLCKPVGVCDRLSLDGDAGLRDEAKIGWC